MRRVGSIFAGRTGIQSLMPKAALSRAYIEPPTPEDEEDDRDNPRHRQAPPPDGMGKLVDKTV